MVNGEELKVHKALSMFYRVKFDVFEGPLDLLLHLVKKNEVELPDIPISVITDQYLAYLDLLKQLDLDIAGEYLVMAATLLHLKSRLLLPVEVTPEEEDGEDPRAELARQLLEYQRFKEAAQVLISRDLLDRNVFTRPPMSGEQTGAEDVGYDLSLGDLLDALQDVIKRTDSEEAQQIILEHISVRDQRCAVLDILREKREVFFHDLFPPGTTRLQIFVIFLAVLELVRNRIIRVGQEEMFGPIVTSLAVSPEEALPEALEHL